MRALNGEEARALLKVAEGDRLEALLVIALSTGMRSGEMLGLQWKAIADLYSHVVPSLQREAAKRCSARRAAIRVLNNGRFSDDPLY